MYRPLLVALVLLAACADHATRDQRWEDRAAALSGEWSVRFDFQPTVAHAARAPTCGTITLTANRAIDRALPRIGLPTNYGTYDVDFGALGFNPSGGVVPAL